MFQHAGTISELAAIRNERRKLFMCAHFGKAGEQVIHWRCKNTHCNCTRIERQINPTIAASHAARFAAANIVSTRARLRISGVSSNRCTRFRRVISQINYTLVRHIFTLV